MSDRREDDAPEQWAPGRGSAGGHLGSLEEGSDQ